MMSRVCLINCLWGPVEGFSYVNGTLICTYISKNGQSTLLLLDIVLSLPIGEAVSVLANMWSS